jgi:putative cardiolipin synthase
VSLCHTSSTGRNPRASGDSLPEWDAASADAVSRSRIAPLRRPSDGLVARLDLIDGAARTLDLQYYLWDSDAVGYLLLSRMIAAADRGVVVRLLVDDLKLRSRTRSIASLCLHPNMEVRVFNPFSQRSNAVTAGLEFIRRFARLDQRMHNKLLVSDDERAIFGGRNIAAEHFGLDGKFNLIDFDLLLSGAEVSDLSHVFDTYWKSPSSVSGTTLTESVTDVDLAATKALIAEELKKGTPTLSTILAEEGPWHHQVDTVSIPLAAGTFSVVSDAPGVSQDTQPEQVIEALKRNVDSAERDLVVVTPFFVPSKRDVEWYQRMVDRGVRIRILTNSLASNQGTISNSGLSKQRLAVVKAGVELRELRTDAAVKSEWETPPQVARYLGLHAKLYVIDRQRVFLGSVNLDPRSKFINTEMGVLIQNGELAEVAADAIVRLMTPDNAWQVEIGPDDGLQWRSDTQTQHRQPARGWGQRLADKFYGLLPIRDYV